MTRTVAPSHSTPRGDAPGASRIGRRRVSVLFGQQVDELEPLVEYARLCESWDTTLWLGQSVIIESHAALAAVAGRGVHVATGLGVAVAPLRSSVDAFSQARSVASLMGRPVAAGYGIGSQEAANRILGQPLTSPARYMASYVSRVKEQVEQAKLTPHRSGGGAGIEVGCGVLRPRMARVAGQVADFAVTWLTPPSYLSSTIAAELDAGAAASGRETPRLVSIVPCALSVPHRNPVRLAALACGQHIRLPHYGDMLRRAGVAVTGDAAADLRAALSTGVFAYGTATDIAEAVTDYHDLGVDEVVLHVGSVGLEHGHRAARDDLESILDAVRASTPDAITQGER